MPLTDLPQRFLKTMHHVSFSLRAMALKPAQNTCISNGATFVTNLNGFIKSQRLTLTSIGPTSSPNNFQNPNTRAFISSLWAGDLALSFSSFEGDLALTRDSMNFPRLEPRSDSTSFVRCFHM